MTAHFEGFYGNEGVAETLLRLMETRRIPQTILLSGPEGVGKATLVRRFAAKLLGDAALIERDDLSLPENIDAIEQRDKWTADKRGDDPLLFSTHPDFATFVPDGPLRQLTVQQMRSLRERAQFKPLKGDRRVFLIDHLERANEQAANSLLKILEEPPEHMVIFATAENLYDVLPTIRSRSIVFQMSKLPDSEMRTFARARSMDDAESRIALAEGSPGRAATIDLDVFKDRRGVLLAAFECSAGLTRFENWVQQSESFGNRKSEKLEAYLRMAYGLLEDVLCVWQGRPAVRHRDVEQRLGAISERVSFRWIEAAVAGLDELVLMVRRNIQKLGALDAMIINLRSRLDSDRT